MQIQFTYNWKCIPENPRWNCYIRLYATTHNLYRMYRMYRIKNIIQNQLIIFIHFHAQYRRARTSNFPFRIYQMSCKKILFRWARYHARRKSEYVDLSFGHIWWWCDTTTFISAYGWRARIYRTHRFVKKKKLSVFFFVTVVVVNSDSWIDREIIGLRTLAEII